MTSKRGLIVDDSKTAQFKLKKLVEGYDLSVDSVFSAEDALSYLSYQTPDIIFMDHSMKGMSGLEAVKIIKLNPVTAIIPVVMYTAETGDVYMSQARAVGAMHVVSKASMSESDIEHVMKSAGIKLLNESVKTKIADSRTKNDAPPLLSSNQASNKPLKAHTEPQASLASVRNQVSRAMDIQHTKIQRDIQDSSRMITRRLMHEVNELRTVLKQQNNRTTAPTVFADLAPYQEPPKQRSVLWTLLPMLMLISAVIYGAKETDDLKKENRSLINANKEFAVALAEQNQSILTSVKSVENQNIAEQSQQTKKLLNGLTWAINQNNHYQYTELAIDVARTNTIKTLVDLLDESNYEGTINIEIHAGNFCIAPNAQGQLMLPEQDALISSCRPQSYYNLDPSRINKLSLEFNEYLLSDPVFQKGDISVIINSPSRYSTLIDYPQYDNSMTAEQWNVAARANNQVLISLQQP